MPISWSSKECVDVIGVLINSPDCSKINGPEANVVAAAKQGAWCKEDVGDGDVRSLERGVVEIQTSNKAWKRQILFLSCFTFWMGNLAGAGGF